MNQKLTLRCATLRVALAMVSIYSITHCNNEKFWDEVLLQKCYYYFADWVNAYFIYLSEY